MRRTLSLTAVLIAGSALLTTSALAQGAGMAKDSMMAVMGKSVTWNAIEVPGFPSGLKLATIHGDPASTGHYTVRLNFPDGYRFPAHWHPNDENVTVMSGTFLLGMGDTFDDAKLTTYQPGDFLFMPATRPHFGKVKGETTIQLHGIGPFVINLAKPSTE